MTRHDAIERAIDRAEGTPFAWGADDCMLWCADAIREFTGLDAAAPFRGRYTDKAGAATVTGANGLAFALMRRARALAWRPVAPEDAVLGDLGIIRTAEGGQACVLRYRGDWWLGRIPNGVSMVRSDAVRFAWSVHV